MAESADFARRTHKGGTSSGRITGTLAAGVTGMVAAEDLADWVGAVANGPTRVMVNRTSATPEEIEVSAVGANSITISARGLEGTQEADHAAGATIEIVSSPRDFDEANFWVAELAAATPAADRFLVSDGVNGLAGKTTSQVLDLLGMDAATLAEVIRDTVGAALVAGTNISLTVDDAGNIITITSAGGAAALAAALSEAASVATAESVTGDSTFRSFPTPGPTVTMDTGTEVWVEVSAEVFNVDPSAGFVYAGVVVSGASTIAAAGARSLMHGKLSYAETRTFGFKLTVTAGTNTFEMVAAHGAATPTWGNRHLRITRLN